MAVCICGIHCERVTLNAAYQNCKVDHRDIGKFWQDGEFPAGKNLKCALACIARATGVIDSYFMPTPTVEEDRGVLNLRHLLFSNADLTKCVPPNYNKRNHCDVAYSFFKCAVNERQAMGKKPEA